jgi:tight adherence protein C
MANPFFLISVLIFLTVILFSLGISSYIDFRRERSTFKERVKRVDQRPETETSARGPGIQTRLLKTFSALGHLIKPKDSEDLSHLRKMFLKAGYRSENSLIVFFGVKVFLAGFLPVLIFLVKLSFLRTLPSFTVMVVAIFLALIGFYAPNLWLRLKVETRKEKILLGLPDALDLMVVCAEAGVGLDSAIQRVGEEMRITNKPLSEEFRLLNLELRAGKLRRDALKNLSLRTDLDDVRSLVTLLVQTERFGTSIAQALRVHSDSMRTKRFQRAEEIAAKLPVKLLFPLIFFIFPSLFVAILGPAILRVYRTLLPVLYGQ